ncbi:MAG: methionine synthase, partial [Bacteroidetes bacterium 4484_249]
VIHVKDASLSVGVSANLISDNIKQKYVNEINRKYDNIRKKYESKKRKDKYISFKEASENKLDIDWRKSDIVKPLFTGNKYFENYPLEEIKEFIDWTFFFHAWKFNGKYPNIFNDPVKGDEAKKLFDDANILLNKIISEKMLTAKAAIGLFPTNSVGEDVEIYKDESRKEMSTVFHFLRNQQQKEAGVPNLCLADFIAPKDSGINDYIGGFAVTTGLGLEKHIKFFEHQNDDYNSIMLKVLADRLAEAFAELIHHKVRKEFWGYAKNEDLSLSEMLKGNYVGIRPAPGYPACPDHSEKETLFRLLNAEKKTGISLTENFAMYPTASVSGYYFAHPKARYFKVGKIGKDQVENYAKRKNMDIEQVEKLLGVNLGHG